MTRSLLVAMLTALAACTAFAPDPQMGPNDGVPAACIAGGDPGRVTLHRLNRTEYKLTVRDVLGDTTGTGSELPADESSGGFDNNADVLSVSPLLYEKYDAAAERLVAEAWARDVTPGPAARIRLCAPASATAAAEDACARQILERFAHRAWRRPVSAEELTRLVGFLAVARGQGEGFVAGTQLAMQSILLSPHFIYRVELDPDPASLIPHALTGSELASRLSYFLWSSAPDDALLAAAEGGALSDPAKLADEVRRMLKDPKSVALADNFAGQWLSLRRVDATQPDPTAFPSFTEPLRDAMRQESRLFFQEFLREPIHVSGMLDAPFTYLNDTLARHYGLPAVGSATPVRVALTSTQRGGLLTQAALLTATSPVTRTSVARRGKFVLRSLLCTEPPPPPPGIPPLPSEATGSQRQKLEAMTAAGSCRGCHLAMNPIGFSMENYDGIGAFRTQDGTFDIDASGKLPDGRAFNGVKQLAGLLKDSPQLTQCISQNVLTYALGRELLAAETCALEQLAEKLETGGGHLSELMVLVAQSRAFTLRRGEP